MRRSALVTAGVLTLGACAPMEPNLSPSQWEAIEARTIEAPAPHTFALVAQSMMDRGYVILVSDSAAGVIRGARSAPPAHKPEPMTALFGEIWPGEAVVYVREAGPTRARVRIQVRQNGVRIADEERVRAWAAELERKALGSGQPLVAPALRAGGAT